MQQIKQFSILLILYAMLYLIVGCALNKPNQPIINTIDTISFYAGGDSIADTTADTIFPLPDEFRVTIERTHFTIQGQLETVEINMQHTYSEPRPIGGFNFLLTYDASALSFQSADPGQFLADCGWEYFTYRHVVIDSSSIMAVRVTSIAETGGNPNHPTCYSYWGSISNQLALLNFLVTNDRTYECTFLPISFYWEDCYDNAMADISGSNLYVNNHIYIFDDTSRINDTTNLTDDVAFPTYYGANGSCDTTFQSDSLRYLNFVNGGVEIACEAFIDTRGDMNLNEIQYEIADAVLYASYFLHGLSVFTINIDGQIAVSDINADGKTLSVADLVYLIRVIIGDANGYPIDIPIQDITAIYPTVTRVIKDGTLNVNYKMGAVSIVIEGDVTSELLADDMTIESHYDSTNTHILVYSLEGNSFRGNFLKVLGKIVSIEFGSTEGGPVVLTK